MNKPYIVYMSSTYKSYYADACDYMREHNIDEKNDIEEVLSEKAFYVYLQDGHLDNHPVIFVRQANYHKP